MAHSTGVSSRLAAFAAGLSCADLPGETVHQARRCLLDWVGCAVAGSSEQQSGNLRRSLRALDGAGAGTAPIVGTSQRSSAPFAALANGFAAHVMDFDDTYNPGDTTVHGSAALWAAILAAAELNPVGGVDAVASFVAGFEVQTRVALAAGPSQYDAGWHVTGTVGHIGAAAAVARLLGLDEGRMLAAIGTGATQAAGMKVVYGSAGKALHPGKAAMDGLLAGHLARQGFTSSSEPIEGHRGFLHLFSAEPAAHRAVAGLGTDWLLPRDGFKPYACGSLTHPAAQAVLELRREHGFTDRDVKSVQAAVHDYVLTTTGNPRPSTGLEGKFSIFHVLAAAVVDGMAMPAQFTDDRVHDPAVTRMRERISVVHDRAQDKDSARVVVTLHDRRRLDRAVRHNLGTPENPMSDQQLEEKMLALATPVLGESAAQRLAGCCWNLTELTDVREVLDASVPPRR
jgi:2-methylcitrate dehydratase PrpD